MGDIEEICGEEKEGTGDMEDREEEVEESGAPSEPENYPVTPANILEEWKNEKDRLEAKVKAMKDSLLVLQTEYLNLTDGSFKATPFEVAEIMLSNYFYVLEDSTTRVPECLET